MSDVQVLGGLYGAAVRYGRDSEAAELRQAIRARRVAALLREIMASEPPLPAETRRALADILLSERAA